MRRPALVATVIGIVLVLALPGSAHAEVPLSRVGWWTRSPTPPTVPEGGISVGAAPDGDITVGAVLVDAGGGATGATLRLVESSGGAGAQVAAIQVCPTSAAWTAVAGGSLADAPEHECDAASVAMTRGDDGTWTADVQALLDGKTGEVGLMVKPASGAVAFQLSFAPPAMDGSVSDVTAPDPGPSSEPASQPAFESPPPSPSPSSSPSFAAPNTPSFVAPVPQTQGAPVQQQTFEPVGGSSATAAAVEFIPQIGTVPSGGGSSSGVTKVTVVLWYVFALVVGAGVAGLSWLKNQGRLSPAVLLDRVRR